HWKIELIGYPGGDPVVIEVPNDNVTATGMQPFHSSPGNYYEQWMRWLRAINLDSFSNVTIGYMEGFEQQLPNTYIHTVPIYYTLSQHAEIIAVDDVYIDCA